MRIGMGIRLLETLTSALYEDPIVLFREYVQNSADAFIRHPAKDSKIEITINQNDRTIEFIDNGYGVELEDFEHKMRSIGISDKGSAIDQIGFRGIGRLSAMPFCQKLIFTNKLEGSSEIQKFSWNGEKYNKLLSQSTSDDLEKAVDEITKYRSEKYIGEDSDHFFKVTLVSYGDEISELIATGDFEDNLSKLLPVKYADSFSAKQQIHDHYAEFMGDRLEKYEFDVFLNGNQLFKPYTDENILESDIVFWDLCFDKTSDDMPNEKIGVMWFTFNRKVSSNPPKSPRGLYVRSKNMLLGTEYAIADSVTKGNKEYVATYRELTQTLNGIYGELLIDTARLSDNARRDWFRIDASSIQLRTILTDFLRKLKAYRYAASQAFNDKQTLAKKQKVIAAYEDLTNGFDSKKFEQEFYDTTEYPKEDNAFFYADDDIPRRSITTKKFYEEILTGLKEYFTSSYKEQGIEIFVKMRTFLKQYLNKQD